MSTKWVWAIGGGILAFFLVIVIAIGGVIFWGVRVANPDRFIQSTKADLRRVDGVRDVTHQVKHSTSPLAEVSLHIVFEPDLQSSRFDGLAQGIEKAVNSHLREFRLGSIEIGAHADNAEDKRFFDFGKVRAGSAELRGLAKLFAAADRELSTGGHEFRYRTDPCATYFKSANATPTEAEFDKFSRELTKEFPRSAARGAIAPGRSRTRRLPSSQERRSTVRRRPWM